MKMSEILNKQTVRILSSIHLPFCVLHILQALNHFRTADTSANSADPDETASNEQSHQELHCLASCY